MAIPVAYRLLLGLLCCCLALLVTLHQDEILPAYFFTDAGTISDLISYVDLEAAEQDSFVATAWVFKTLGGDGGQLLIILAVLAVCLLICNCIQTPLHLGVALVYLVPLLLYNLKLSKETIVLVLNLTCIAVALLCRRHATRVILVVALYLTYAYFFRVYYAFVALLILFLSVFWAAKPRLRLVLLAFLVLACLAVPGEVWNSLQLPRDQVNQSREGLSDSKTLFTNPLTPNGLATVLPNSGYAAVRFYFAPLFSLRVQELLLAAVLWGMTLLLLSKRNPGHVLACIAIGNFIIQTFFEPDLGSFLRHLCAYAFCLFALPTQTAVIESMQERTHG
ncbi:hypothetical protein [Pseudomonas oryzihabitans]|uniref:hypothetical protein n=1 Tax=Pseudomonas oryzihabitans TaxID=47885 RepID=UPI00111DBCE7|nr:hypothetical protein [Pseudomonas psychrotolerans]QDD87982.1 hypothetical protein CCZ28_02795 [Pseudomonas psychrotolerans]